jgi:hypothetical protein
MPRTPIPFAAADTSALARSLNAQLVDRETPPSHVEMLNMLARAAGFRNFQHFRASQEAAGRLNANREAPEPVDHTRIERAARHFDAQTRLIHWPGRQSHQELCLWILWAAFEPRRVWDEPQVNGLLNARHLFGDPALLRRALVDYGLLTRTADCREYRRIERKPPSEAIALIRHLAHRSA